MERSHHLGNPVTYPYDGTVWIAFEAINGRLRTYSVGDTLELAKQSCREAMGLEFKRSDKDAGIYWVDETLGTPAGLDSGTMIEMVRDGTPCGMYIEHRTVRRRK